jgi:hypothetical protein
VYARFARGVKRKDSTPSDAKKKPTFPTKKRRHSATFFTLTGFGPIGYSAGEIKINGPGNKTPKSEVEKKTAGVCRRFF